MEFNNRIINIVNEIIRKSNFKNNECSMKNTAKGLQLLYYTSGFDESYKLTLLKFMRYIKSSRDYIADLQVFVQLRFYYSLLFKQSKYCIGTRVMYENKIHTVEDYISYLDLYLF